MKSKIFALVVLSTLVLFSCKKEDKKYSIDSNGTKTSYPSIKLLGDEVVSIPIGGSYNEAGFEATDSIYPSGIQTSTSGEVNSAEAGMYIIVYTAKNSIGLKSTAVRLVAVTDMPDAFDISGDYMRGSAGIGTLAKVGKGIFSFNNCGGLPPGAYPNYFYVKLNFCFIDSNTIVCPPQPTSNGTAYFVNADIDYNTPVTMSWNLNSSGYSPTATRVFVKQ